MHSELGTWGKRLCIFDGVSQTERVPQARGDILKPRGLQRSGYGRELAWVGLHWLRMLFFAWQFLEVWHSCMQREGQVALARLALFRCHPASPSAFFVQYVIEMITASQLVGFLCFLVDCSSFAIQAIPLSTRTHNISIHLTTRSCSNPSS